jgi:hypothetical protein
MIIVIAEENWGYFTSWDIVKINNISGGRGGIAEDMLRLR